MKAYKIKVNGNDYEITVKKTTDNQASVKVNGMDYEVEVDTTFRKVNKPLLSPTPAPTTSAPVQSVASVRPAAAPSSGSAIKSPLPGVILDIFVKEGDTVKEGQKLMMLEAMKMENNIEAESNGVVTKINVSKGSSVLEGDVLISIG